MKSSDGELKKRGYLEKGDERKYSAFTPQQLMDKISMEPPSERTAIIVALRSKCFAEDEHYNRLLLEWLRMERALYTRLELCSSLEMGNAITAEIMCEYIGGIGNNQYKLVPNEVSKKKCYPLPRDLIARSLGRMNPCVLPVLTNHLIFEEKSKVSELLDAIGYMIFYHPELATSIHFNNIKLTYDRFVKDELIVWKTTRCCSAFPIEQSEKLLLSIKEAATHQTIIEEAERSLRFIYKRIEDIKDRTH